MKVDSQKLDEEMLKPLASKEFVRERIKGVHKESIDLRRKSRAG